jgi:hypothetical protein
VVIAAATLWVVWWQWGGERRPVVPWLILAAALLFISVAWLMGGRA